MFRLFCQHDYKLVNQFETKSEFDIVCSYGLTPNSHTSMKYRIISDYKCTKCNKLKRLQTVSKH